METMVCLQVTMLSWIFMVQKWTSIPTNVVVFLHPLVPKSTFICLPNTIHPMTMLERIESKTMVVPSRTSTPMVPSHTYLNGHSHTYPCRTTNQKKTRNKTRRNLHVHYAIAFVVVHEKVKYSSFRSTSSACVKVPSALMLAMEPTAC